MDQRVLDFLNKERVCSLSVSLPDGRPHSASMHFWIDANPFSIYFLTFKDSRKFGQLKTSEKASASIAVGFDEGAMVGCQLDGDLTVIKDEDEKERLKKLDITKNPHHHKFYPNPSAVIIKFTPLWWKYTEFKADPKIVISSEAK